MVMHHQWVGRRKRCQHQYQDTDHYRWSFQAITLSQTLINRYNMKNVFILILLFLFGQVAFSQSSNFVISYPISFPMGNLKEYNTKTSFRGITIEFNKHVQAKNSDVGLESAWNVFY